MRDIELSLRKCVAPEFIFGLKARLLAGQYAKNLGAKNPLIVTDPGIRAHGWVDEVCRTLSDAGLGYHLFDNIVPNPRDHNVNDGVQVYKSNNCDSLIAIGGGSPMDCAKGIGIVVSNGGNILDYEGIDNITQPLPPLLCIPTTAGSAADVSQFAIINDVARSVKIAIISKSIVPDLALIDPEITTSMPFELTIHTGLDALTHAMEAYVSNASSPITDMYALESIGHLLEGLPQVAKNLENIEARGKVMLGSLLAGMAFSNASLGAVHAMAHSLGGRMDLPHGLCNALLLGSVCEYNFSYAKNKYTSIAHLFGCKDNHNIKKEFLKKVHAFTSEIGLNTSLRSLGVDEEILPKLAQLALKDPCIVTNPVLPTQKEMESIYAAAL
jgi:alcohol dehydrogenase class IV